MIYLAYGSNLHIGQMQFRCRTAEVLGTSTLHGYRLVFNGVATIEPDSNSRVVPQRDRAGRAERQDSRCDGLHHEQQRHRTAQPLLLRCDPQGLRDERAGHRSSGTGTEGIPDGPLNAPRSLVWGYAGFSPTAAPFRFLPHTARFCAIYGKA